MKRIIFLLLLGSLTTLCGCERISVSNGIDFANGEWVGSEIRGAGKNEKEKIIRSGSFIPEWTEVLKKYSLSHPRPVITYVSGTSTLEDGTEVCWDGESPFVLFFEIVKRFQPPEDEVRALYREAIRRFEAADADSKYKAVNSFLTEIWKKHNAAPLDAILKKLLEAPDGKLLKTQDVSELFARFLETRDRYPGELPAGFYLTFLFDKTEEDVIAALADEFIRQRTERAAFLLAFALVFRGKCNVQTVEHVFARLNKAGAAAQFAGIVRPAAANPPPLPEPLKKTSGPYHGNTYYEDTFAALPERAFALQLAFNPEYFETAFFRGTAARFNDAKDFQYVIEKYLFEAGYVVSEKHIRFGGGRVSPVSGNSSLRHCVPERDLLAGFRKIFREFAVPDFPKTLLDRMAVDAGGKMKTEYENRNVKAYFRLLEKYRPPKRVVAFTIYSLPYQDEKIIEKVFANYAERRRAAAVPFTEAQTAEMKRLVEKSHNAANKNEFYSYSIVQDSWHELSNADWRDTSRLPVYLRFAVLAYSPKLVKILLEHRAFDPGSMDGEDLLIDAIDWVRGTEVLKLLIDAGANVNAKWDRAALARELESLGAKLLVNPTGFESPVRYFPADNNGITKRSEVVDLFIRAGLDPKMLNTDSPGIEILKK